MSAWLSSSSSESHLYSFFSLLSSHPVRCNELERCESQRTVPIKWLTPEKLLLDRRHFGKERFRTWWECLSAFTRIITAGQLSPVTVVRESSRRARSIQPKFPEISVQNSMDRFGPTGKVSKKRVHLLRWSSFPGRTGWNFG